MSKDIGSNMFCLVPPLKPHSRRRSRNNSSLKVTNLIVSHDLGSNRSYLAPPLKPHSRRGSNGSWPPQPRRTSSRPEAWDPGSSGSARRRRRHWTLGTGRTGPGWPRTLPGPGGRRRIRTPSVAPATQGK